MMINKRLISLLPQSKKFIFANVLFQWVSLLANISAVIALAFLLQNLYKNTADLGKIFFTAALCVFAAGVKYFCTKQAHRMSTNASIEVKRSLRQIMYKKLLCLDSYTDKISTAELVQLCSEGVEQLESYFGLYLPQLIYSLLAPVTLFFVLSFINFYTAAVLLLCVPLIPVTIAAVQTFAKKLLSKYWGQYSALSDSFLENLQGLTTLKIYSADGLKHSQMNRQAENFRKITMKVLTMQLNSITVMDVIAYGGAALGIALAAAQYNAGAIGLAGGLSVILLSADYYIPMRLLGSFFHIAMNGMAASDKIFSFLDLAETKNSGSLPFNKNEELSCKNLRFGYDTREILHSISLSFKPGSFTAIVGESGCGKSTLAALLTGRKACFTGEITIGGTDIRQISAHALKQEITYISHNSYLFKGTVRENLLMGCPEACDLQLWQVLKQVKLDGFLNTCQGLDTCLDENGSNISGGQRQRLALARAILHNSSVYIFDEATSNIDAESENHIIKQIYRLAKVKTVILITHRLTNAKNADNIYVLQNGEIKEKGIHEGLLKQNGLYTQLWQAQSCLESYETEETA